MPWKTRLDATFVNLMRLISRNLFGTTFRARSTLFLVSFLSCVQGATGQTVVSLGAMPSPAIYGQSAALTATVTPASATGKVTFYDGAAILGVSSVSGGQATLTTKLLSPGTRSLRAYYGGDANNAAANSATVAQTVRVNATGGFGNPASYTVG